MGRAKVIKHPQFELTTRGKMVFLVCHEEYWNVKGERKYSEVDYPLEHLGAPTFPATTESLKRLYRDLEEFLFFRNHREEG